MSIRFHSAVSDAENSEEALGSVIDDAQRQLDSADVAFLFFTTHHRDSAEEMVEKILLEFSTKALVGCTCEGVIGGEREIERAPGLTLFLGQTPGVIVRPFHIATDDWQSIIEDGGSLAKTVGITDSTRAVIGFGDPWTTPLTQFMQALDRAAPNAPLVGGMASGARSPGGNLLACNDALVDDGFVGISLSGAIDVQTVVSQGCKPIGSPLVITKAKENIIEQLGGKPAMIVLRDLINVLSPADQELLQHGLLIGRAISEYRETFGRGDFLVRNLAGADQETGAIAVADYVRVGQTIQFHVRDAATADEDLSLMLSPDQIGQAPAGALLFTCNGRGRHLFDSPNHDIAMSREKMPGTPVGGFFAAGEIGPVGGKNFIHGHTASFALLRAPGGK